MSSSDHPQLPFEPQLESVDAWLAGLPVENSRECCRQLYAGLQTLNASGLDPVTHCRILERLRPLAELESGKLLAGIVGKPLPLDERLRKSAKLSAQFQAELARGFQSVVSDERAVSDLPADEWVRLVHRALSAYEQYLLRLALMYETAAPSLWSRVHELYRLAEHYGFAGRGGTEIGEVFARMLAFRLACPNRLEQAEVQRLFDVLHQHGRLVELSKEPMERGVLAAFSIDVDKGTPPGAVRAGDQHQPRESQRFLHTHRLLRQLALQVQPTVPERERLAEGFAVRVQVRLGGRPPYSLEQKGRRAMLLGGLESLLDAAEKSERQASAENAWTGPGKLELLPFSDHQGVHPLSESSKSAGTFSAATSARKPAAAGGDIWGRSEGDWACQVYPADTPGFYLLDAGGLALRPGSLVGLNTDNKLIQAGLVGTARPASGLCVFELLANDVSTVQVSGAAVGSPYAALFAQSADESKCSLLGPPSKLRNGDMVVLERRARRQNYRIARLLESTEEFTQFELIAVADAPGEA